LLNAAQKTTAVVLAAAVFKALANGDALALDDPHDVFAIGGLFISYYVFNVIPLMLTLALVQRRRFLSVLHANVQSIYLDFVGTFLFALLPAFVYEKEPRLLPILAGVGVLVRQVFELANRLRSETEEALRVLIDIVDARDPYTHDHSLLVAEYSRRVAEMMVTNPNEIEAIVSAAMLHDIGKIGVSDTILLKDSRLSPEEKRLMELHPEIGRRILEKYSQFRGGAEIVFAHQEHYDGGGYPRGLRGEEIPLGARIIAVVDAYVAMRTDRPYRRAMSAAEALAQLRSGIGTQFDPVVCANFIKLLIESDQISQDQVVQMAELRDRREHAAR
jgi:HD-GYP domain-containing protein (c-di-GMP phosphodiesterase class II)